MFGLISKAVFSNISFEKVNSNSIKILSTKNVIEGEISVLLCPLLDSKKLPQEILVSNFFYSISLIFII